MYSTISLLKKMQGIQGWLKPHEADCLINLTHKACLLSGPPQNIVEIGSFHGRSTVVFGTIVKGFYPGARVYAIDPHEGILGSSNRLRKVPPTLESFKQNIAAEKLTKVVELIQKASTSVEWNKSISLLFIDGLHDYGNVSKDFWHFFKWVKHGGYIAFHDYSKGWPGVMKFVDEIIAGDKCQKIHQVQNLMVVQKV